MKNYMEDIMDFVKKNGCNNECLEEANKMAVKAIAEIMEEFQKVIGSTNRFNAVLLVTALHYLAECYEKVGWIEENEYKLFMELARENIKAYGVTINLKLPGKGEN